MPRNGEHGRIGQKRYGGIFYEEFVPQLAGIKGIKAFQEMSENDDVVGAILFAIEMLIRQCEFSIEPADEDNKTDQKAAEFIHDCMHDMEQTWQDTLSEILSFLTYGWSFHEIVYKRRTGGAGSKYNDNLIGWKKLPIRAQETLYEWRYKDGSDDLLGMVQVTTPDHNHAFIPLEKALHFRTRSRKNNPEGRSVLRNAYRSWYFKKRMQEIEGIGVERDLAGYPVLKPPPKIDIWDEEDIQARKVLAHAERIVQNIRRDELEGVVIPNEWELTLLTSGSRRNFDVGAIIDRYDKRMATTVLADFIFLGQGQTGSFALSSDKTRLFALSVGTYLDVICDVFNQAIRRLIDLNKGHFVGISDYPTMTHGDIEDANLAKFGDFISQMVRAGVLSPSLEVENYVRDAINLPPKTDYDDDYGFTAPQQNDGKEDRGPRRRKSDISDEPEPTDEDDTKDTLIAEEAKKSLGRGISQGKAES